jgi:hypothetical protein
MLCGAGRSFVKNTLIVSGSEREPTAFLLASESEYRWFDVRSILKKSVSPAMFTSTTTSR